MAKSKDKGEKKGLRKAKMGLKERRKMKKEKKTEHAW